MLRAACSILATCGFLVPGAGAQDLNCKVIQGLEHRAAAVAGTIAGNIKDVTLTAVGDSTILACGNNKDSPLVSQLIDAIKKTADSQRVDTHSVRLFFNRNASAIATALAKATGGVDVKAVGDDLLVFPSQSSGDDPTIHELKRWVALLDVPMPQVALNAWSLQVSSRHEEEVAKASVELRRLTQSFDEKLRRSLDSAWKWADKFRFQTDYPDPKFTQYVMLRWGEDKDPASAGEPGWCAPTAYCLGFSDAFPADRPMEPTLTNLLGVLAGARMASHEPEKLAKEVRHALEGEGMPVAVPVANETCLDEDARVYSTFLREEPKAPAFACFQRQVAESFGKKRLAVLRTAIANFFFHYKQSVQYPHDFIPYDFAFSLQSLNKQLDPLLVAFNQDVEMFLNNMQARFEKPPSKIVDFQSSGIITLRTISGVQSEVDAKTQNLFAETPPPLVQDFLSHLQGQTAPSTVLTENLATRGAMALQAFLASGASTRVSIGREMDFTVTPHSLPGASAAELEIKMDTKDSGSPSIVKADDSTSQTDTTNRVAGHMVQSNVRVDSLKLFEVSSFAEAVSRGRKPYPLLPPLVELPGIGSFVKYKPGPVTVYHRSFGIVSATIVPTAADMLNGLRFHDDLGKDGARKVPPAKSLEFHQKMLDCIAKEAAGEDPGAACPQARLSTIGVTATK